MAEIGIKADFLKSVEKWVLYAFLFFMAGMTCNPTIKNDSG